MITNIRLQNFRSYNDSTFEFEDGVNIVVGPNAAGKTNLLEALFMIARNRPFRVKDGDTLKFNSSWMRLDSYCDDKEVTIKIQKENEKFNKTTIINGKEYKRLPINLYSPIVLFEPSQLNLLSGGPEPRRVFVDELIVQEKIKHNELLTKYKRVISQRNSLLKRKSLKESDYFVWNMRLVELATEIVKNRQDICRQINKNISEIYSQIAGKKNTVRFEYSSKNNLQNYNNDLLNKLESGLQQDVLKGYTSYGPHRDDIGIYINNNLANITASRGESRTMLLALKSFEIDRMGSILDKKPILLLDDVFSELDGLRRKELTSYINRYQSFITTTDADIFSKRAFRSTRTIVINN